MNRPARTATLSRRVAHKVLLRVERDGAFSNLALEGALRRHVMPRGDAAFATELVYGTLRHQGRLDFYLARLATRPLRKAAPAVLVGLRLGAYQVLETRVPDHSAVSESVALFERGSRHASFVNAVLRKLANLNKAGKLPDPETELTDPCEALAVSTSHPPWLVRRLAEVWGEQWVREWALANNEPPAVPIRVNRLKVTRAQAASAFREAQTAGVAARVEIPVGPPQALLLRGAGDVRALPGFTEGHFSVQDPAAQLVGYLCAPRPGSVVLDVCAAPGGKATHLAELMGDKGKVLAADVHLGRAGLVKKSAERLGLECVVVVAVDATSSDSLRKHLQQVGVSQVPLALVDAPCSGLGTLRRNPELRYRPVREIGSLCQVQDRLLDAVVPLIAPGGALVYAVCTITEEEGPERVARFLERHPEFCCVAPEAEEVQPFVELAKIGEVEAPVLRTWPHEHGTDGFFAVRLQYSL